MPADPDLGEHRPDPKTRWLLSHDRWRASADAATRALGNPAGIPRERLLKAGTRRLVFIVAGSGSAVPDAIVKAFPLEGLRVRIKHDKYAPSEARNLREAARRDLPVPALYGVGEHRRLGLVRWNAVLMEKIDGRTFAEVMSRGVESERRHCLERTVALLRRVFDAGCNHIDLKPEALIFGAEPSQDRILDFQYCRFASGPSVATLMAQAGHFAHWWSRDLGAGDTEIGVWVDALIDAIEVPASQREDARAIFEINRERVPSIAERLQQ